MAVGEVGIAPAVSSHLTMATVRSVVPHTEPYSAQSPARDSALLPL